MNELFQQYLLAGERAGMRYTLTVPRLAVLGSAGMQLGQRAGSSLEFRDHRDYQPGDDLRRIDWSAFARSDKLTVKLYREEINPQLDIVLDGSRSMALAESAKAEAAIGLAALFAVAAENAGYAHTAWLTRAACERVANSHLRPAAWAGLALDYAGQPAEALHRLPPAWRRQGMRVFISDLLWLGEPAEVLRVLARDAALTVVVQVLAAQDANPPERGRLRLVDAETGEAREIFVDEEAMARYRSALARHQQNWQTACRQTGALLVNLIAEEVVAGWQLGPLVALEILKV
jgi:uncharacterized protein (DUF58 family)